MKSNVFTTLNSSYKLFFISWKARVAPDTHLLKVGSQVLRRWPPCVYLHLHVFTSSDMFLQYIASFGGTVFHTFLLHSSFWTHSHVTQSNIKTKAYTTSILTAYVELIRPLLHSENAVISK